MNTDSPGLTAYSAGRPLLLITDGPPDAGGGGTVILRSLLGPEERSRMVWASLTPPASPDAPGEVTLRRGSAGKGRRSIVADSTYRAAGLADEAAELAEARDAAAIWVVMHGAGVHVAARLARLGRRPLHLTVHDDPAYGVALRSRRYVGLVPWIARDFRAAMRGAASVDVIGEGMAARYRRLYGVESAIVHRAVPGPIAASPPYDRASHGLRVGVLGTTYSYDQLPILGRAIADAAARVGARGSLLIVGQGFGDRLRADMAGAIDVESTGHIPEPEGIRRLQDCLALYLNYPSGRRDAVLRQTSFPTKLSTYVRAARPLLVHAPPDSSTVPVCRRDPSYAIHWPSRSAADGARLLERLWADPAADGPFDAPAEAVRERYFDPGVNRRALFDALNALASRPAVPPAANPPAPDASQMSQVI